MTLLTTRFKRFLRRWFERLLNEFYEGPTPPARIEQGVRVFAALNPGATVGDWVDFAARHAEEAYRSGHVRGLEWAERDLDRRDPAVDPEHLLDRRRHDWSWVEQHVSEAQLRRVVEENPMQVGDYHRALALDSLGRYFGGYRVEVIPVRDSKRR